MLTIFILLFAEIITRTEKSDILDVIADITPNLQTATSK